MTDQIIPADLLTRGKVLTGLRQLADWLEAHPDIPAARWGWDLHVCVDDPRARDEATGRAEVDRIAAVLGVSVDDRTARGGHYTASRTFGLITYQVAHISERHMADYAALMSYSGSVLPEVTP
jgi:hypothetical protein